MKKLLVLALVGGLLLSGCSSTNEPEATPEATPEVTATPETTPEVSEPTVEMSELQTLVSDIIANYEGPEMPLLTSDVIAGLYLVTPEMITDIAAFKPMQNTQGSEVIVATAAEGQLEALQLAIETYMVGSEESWSTYLPDQYELVKARVELTVGNTVIAIVHPEAEAIAADIEAALQ